MPNIAVPAAVAKTIKDVVKAFIPPMYLTPYISAQKDEPRTFAKPLHTPTNPKKKKAEIGLSNEYKTIAANRSGIFMNISNFLLVNLSIKKPVIDNVTTLKIE